MPRSNSDNFGDIAVIPPTPNTVPSENAQLEERDLNTTGLPVGVRDDERETEKEATSDGKASGTRKRKNGDKDKAGEEKLEEPEKAKSMSFAEKLRSPLGSTLNLGEIRNSISRNVELQFAPLYIPRHRRQQTGAVALWALLLPICLFCFLMIMSYPRMWYIMIPYLTWMFIDKAPTNGGRPREWARRLPIWKSFAQYYPCSIVKEADLPPDRPYLFGYHPHGIIGMGAFATFATEGTGFSDFFPGINPHLLTLDSNFKIPFYRDLMMLHGLCSVSKPSCFNILKQGPGSAITIVVGGASESLSAHPGTADLTLKKRYGFIKMAIRAGADLVPVFSFGENDIWAQLANEPGSLVYRLQRKFQAVFGFTLPLFYGRGLFNYSYGFMPFRHPIVSVVGRPINVKQHDDPSDEQVQELQKLYIDELTRIWDRYKDIYAQNRTKELTIVE